MREPFETVALGAAPVVAAPDGSAVRPLCVIPGAGSFANFRLDAGEVAKAVVHRTVQEIWYVVGGAGTMWRRAGDITETVDLYPGVCVTIPLGTHFQFRAAVAEPLEVVAATMPPWPVDSPDEATVVTGPWKPTF
ncbi:cupin domain-containing protein [Actinoplanes sp. NPDC026619]|uniref:cupin domain-containing protein n=1 Tax=Actinoplanes sp. NPDC026619 TaxID=3155798 RepID=UPI0033E2007B